MKKYPRIHTLGTINVRHHEKALYDIHALRTDFSGDSGHGKSMIADLLQLIFVGPYHYRAATEGMEKSRPLNTLPIPGQPFAYAFLNVEMEYEKFITIGVYQENTLHSTKMFIIQGGYGFSNSDVFEPFEAPTLISDFQRENLLLPITELSEHFETKQRGIESWSRTKPYHTLLYTNGLLPVDLAGDEHTHKTFAGVLQAFARGRNLGMNGSGKLGNFLFGPDKARKIHNSYDRTLDEWERDKVSYGNRLEDIEKIKEREDLLKEVYRRKLHRDEERRKYLTLNWQYYKQQLQSINHENRSFSANNSNARTNFKWADQKTSIWIIEASERTAELTEERDKTNKEKYESEGLYNRLERVLKWQQDFKCGILELKNHYEEDRANRIAKRHWTYFKNQLESNRLADIVEQSDWPHGTIQGNQWHQSKVHDLQNELLVLKTAANFFDPSNTESIGYWAMHYPKSFDIDQVSVLMGLKALSLTKAKHLNSNLRYLPDPSALFSNLQSYITEREENGFWLSFGEMREYFAFETNELLSNPDPAQRRNLLDNVTKSLKSEIVRVDDEIKNLKKIAEIILEYSNPAELLTSYVRRKEVENFVEYLDFSSVQPDEFERYLALLDERRVIEEAYKSAKINDEKCQEALTNNAVLLSKLDGMIIDIVKWRDYAVDPPDDWAFTNDSFSDITLFAELFEANEYLRANLVEELHRSIEAQRTYLADADRWVQFKEKWKLALENAQNAEIAYLKHYEEVPFQQDTQLYDKPSSDAVISAEAEYKTQYEGAIKRYFPDDVELFKGVDDFMQLYKHMFPDLSSRQLLAEDTVIEDLAKMLQDINNALYKLNRRKLEDIGRLLKEVQSELTTMRHQVSQIQSLLNREDNLITGGHQMKLIWKESEIYPFRWIDTFHTELANSTSFDKHFASKLTIEESMLDAFHFCGGSTALKATVRDLLNPNNYVDLRYEMKSPVGEVIDGSTGQAFAAIAMLCIAQLSTLTNKNRKGLRYMAVDEADGLGTNYDLLMRIARQFDYQIISLSLHPLDSFVEGQQHIHILCSDISRPGPYNHSPMSILSPPIEGPLQ